MILQFALATKIAGLILPEFLTILNLGIMNAKKLQRIAIRTFFCHIHTVLIVCENQAYQRPMRLAWTAQFHLLKLTVSLIGKSCSSDMLHFDPSATGASKQKRFISTKSILPMRSTVNFNNLPEDFCCYVSVRICYGWLYPQALAGVFKPRPFLRGHSGCLCETAVLPMQCEYPLNDISVLSEIKECMVFRRRPG